MRSLFVFVLLLANQAFAGAGGSAKFKLSVVDGASTAGGDGAFYFLDGNTRLEATMSATQALGVSMKQVVVVRADKPQTIFLLNDAAKSYTEMDAAQSLQNSALPKLSVKKLGKEKVAGYECEHALVSQDNGETFEVWTTDKIKGFDYKTLQKTYAAMQKQDPFTELERAGLKGFMMKMHTKPKSGGQLTFEITSIDTRLPDRKLFEVPAGYSKNDPNNPMSMMGQVQGIPPELQQQLMQQLQNLTPEQREQMRKMMGQ